MEHFSCKVSVIDMDAHVSSHLKEELTWAANKINGFGLLLL